MMKETDPKKEATKNEEAKSQKEFKPFIVNMVPNETGVNPTVVNRLDAEHHIPATPRELTIIDVKKFCGIDEYEDAFELKQYMEYAYSYIATRVGLPDIDIPEYRDLTFAYLVLVNEMYNNRDYTVIHDKLNPTVEAILNMHSRNLIA